MQSASFCFGGKTKTKISGPGFLSEGSRPERVKRRIHFPCCLPSLLAANTLLPSTDRRVPLTWQWPAISLHSSVQNHTGGEEGGRSAAPGSPPAGTSRGGSHYLRQSPFPSAPLISLAGIRIVWEAPNPPWVRRTFAKKSTPVELIGEGGRGMPCHLGGGNKITDPHKRSFVGLQM